ncbi:response regulator transcription factor [Paenibacillus soyae]|uniref:Response regulator transcription factor n=1 Tax=Paenibacillus soyae TaxID=2969249 RepID=A0A9X2MTU0_9BACL|nr:response regulator transcription factor [Paenibacillus soyae]MCR2806355.1 response regulator transcription factor [Paenibacillus soyae]
MKIWKILIADDHPMYRKGLRTILETVDDMEVAGEATNGEEAIALCERESPDVILMDIRMPGMNGVDAARHIKKHYPDVQILFLTMHQDDTSVLSALKTGARGYFLKDADKDEIIRAIRAVTAGEAIFSAEVAARMIDIATRPVSRLDQFSQLTAREKEVLHYMAEGYSNAQIGAAMDLTAKTVSNYVTLILNKLHAADRTEAIRMVEKAKNEI